MRRIVSFVTAATLVVLLAGTSIVVPDLEHAYTMRVLGQRGGD